MRHLLNLLIAVCFPQIHCSVPVGIVNSGDPSYSSSSFYWNNRSQRATWFRSVQSFDHIWFIVIPWTAACQAFLSITNSQTLLKLMSIKLAMPSNHLILCHSLLLLPSICPSIRVFSPASGIKELSHWKNPWFWERLRAGGEGDDRGWYGWMALPTWWTWVWLDSGSWCWTGRPGLLWLMESQRVGHHWVTELNWLEDDIIYLYIHFMIPPVTPRN